jgi:hypothetical protein
MRILFIVLISTILASCGRNDLILESIALAEHPIEGGIPVELRFKDLNGVNMDYDNLPTDNYLVHYTFTNIRNEVFEGESYLGGWQKENTLLVNIALLSSKSHTDEANSFFNSGIYIDSLRSIEIKIYDGGSPDTDDLMVNKFFAQKEFKQLDGNIDFYSY